jgi:hypothetical protein
MTPQQKEIYRIGRAEGRAQGLVLGRAQGRAEGQAQAEAEFEEEIDWLKYEIERWEQWGGKME